MSGPKNITAVVRIDDAATPAIKALAAEAERLFAVFGAGSKSAAGGTTAIAAELKVAAKGASLLATELGAADKAAHRLANAGLSKVSHDLNAAGRSAEAFAGKIGLAQRAAHALHETFRSLAGLAGMIAGAELVHGVGAASKAGATNQQQIIRYEALPGVTPEEKKHAMDHAAQVARKSGSMSMSEALETRAELRAMHTEIEKKGGHSHIAPNEEALDRNVELIAQGRARSRAVGVDFENAEAQALLRMADKQKPGDVQWYSKLVDMYLKGKINWGRNLDANKITTFTENAGTSLENMSEDEVMNAFFFMTVDNAARLGNARKSEQSQLIGGQMRKASAAWLADHGLIPPDAAKPQGTGTSQTSYDSSKLKGRDMLTEDPTRWAQEYVLPALRQPGKELDQKNIAKETTRVKEQHPEYDDTRAHRIAETNLTTQALYSLGLRSTTLSRIAEDILLDGMRERETFLAKATNLEALDTAQHRNPVAMLKTLAVAMEDFAQAVTTPGMESIAGMLSSLAEGLRSLTGSIREFSDAHPDMAKAMTFGALGAGTGVGGWLMTGLFSLGTAGPALSASAVELSASAAALSASARGGVPGAVAGGTTGAATATASTGAAVAAVGTGGLPAAIVGGGYIAALGLAASAALSGLNELAKKTGKREWTFGRMVDVFLNGGDTFRPDEAKQELERRIALRKAGIDPLKPDKAPEPNVMMRRTNFRDAMDPNATPDYEREREFALDAMRHRKDDDLDPDAGRPHAWGVPVGLPDYRTQRPLPAGMTPAPDPVKVETHVTGEAELHQSVTVEVGLDGKARRLLERAIALPLNTGNQGAGAGSSLKSSGYDDRHF